MGSVIAKHRKIVLWDEALQNEAKISLFWASSSKIPGLDRHGSWNFKGRWLQLLLLVYASGVLWPFAGNLGTILSLRDGRNWMEFILSQK